MKALQTMISGFLYAAVVFAVGFVLGAIRVFFAVPRIGVRWAEILEAPLMLFASFLAARFIVRLRGPFGRIQSASIGVFALIFMLAAEFGVVIARGQTIAEYVATRDHVSGSVYLMSLCLFAAMPLLVSLIGASSNRIHQ